MDEQGDDPFSITIRQESEGFHSTIFFYIIAVFTLSQWAKELYSDFNLDPNTIKKKGMNCYYWENNQHCSWNSLRNWCMDVYWEKYFVRRIFVWKIASFLWLFTWAWTSILLATITVLEDIQKRFFAETYGTISYVVVACSASLVILHVSSSLVFLWVLHMPDYHKV